MYVSLNVCSVEKNHHRSLNHIINKFTRIFIFSVTYFLNTSNFLYHIREIKQVLAVYEEMLWTFYINGFSSSDFI